MERMSRIESYDDDDWKMYIYNKYWRKGELVIPNVLEVLDEE